MTAAGEDAPLTLMLLKWNVGICIHLALGALVLVAAVHTGFAHGPADEAIERLTQRIESDGESAELYLSRGELHRAQGDWASAERDLDRAAGLDPDRVEVDLYRGRLMLAQSRYAPAEAALSRVIAATPDNAGARALRARALAELGRRREASDEYGAAIARQPNPSPVLYLERARLLATGDDAERREALGGLDAGLAKLQGATTLELLAIELELAGADFDAALARLGRIEQRSSRKDPWLMRRAEILEAAGRDVEAAAALNRALDAMADLPASRRDSRDARDSEARIRDAMLRLASREGVDS